jgi:hypothetical protein
MDLAGRATSLVLRLAAAVGLGAGVLCVILGGIGFLAAGVFIHLDHRLGPAQAAIAIGAGLLVLALLIAVIGGYSLKKFRKRRPSLLAEFGATFGLGARLAALLVRRDPRKAVVLAALAGAVAEYLFADSRKDR